MANAFSVATKMISVETGHPSAYFPLRINKSKANEGNSVVPIKFPSTRKALWESKPVADFETLALNLPNHPLQLFIVEKSLRLAHRYAEDKRLTSFLLGSVYPKSGESGICFGVDRFDPGREITEKIGENVTKSKVPTAVVPGDHIIPITVKKELQTSDDSVSHTKNEFARGIQVMENKICGKDVLTLSHVVSLKANLYCCRELDELIITLHCGAIVPDTKFQARPIAPLAIIPTTLARNLAGPLRLSDVQGTPKMGYVTMDQTRKLLLLLESDPKVYNLPLIGIWISGVHDVHHPYVWAACLRYFNCCEIKDRVLHSSGSFLLLHYSIIQKIPDFWECFLDHNESLDFELLSCQENLHLDMDDCTSKEPLCFHLTPSPTGMNKSLFDEAIAEWKNSVNIDREIKQNDENNGHPNMSVLKNDENPRPTPSPHPSPTQVKTPYVPAPEESLSLSFDETTNNCDKNQSEETRGKAKTLAPRFKQTPNSNPSKQIARNPDNFNISRQPFKQITPQDRTNSPNNFLERGKPVVLNRNQACRKEDNKENTPLTSRNVAHVHRRSPNVGTGKNVSPFSERNNQASRGQTVGVHHEKTLLSHNNSSNRSAPVKVNQAVTAGVRQRCHSEDIQSHQKQRPENPELHRTRANSHSSLALSDEDSDISLDSSFTKNTEVKRAKNQSPSYLNGSSNQLSPSRPNHSPRVLPSNGESWSLASKQSDDIGRREVDTRNQKHTVTRQNSPKLCGMIQQSSGSKTSPLFHPHTHPRSFNTLSNIRGHFNDRNSQQTNPRSYQSTRVTPDDERQTYGNTTSQRHNQTTAQRQISDVKQFSAHDSDNETSCQCHGNPDVKPSSPKPSSHNFNTRCEVQKSFVDTPNQPSDHYEKQPTTNTHNDVNKAVMFSKSDDVRNHHLNGSLHGTNTQPIQPKYCNTTKSPSLNSSIIVPQAKAESCRNTKSETLTKYKKKKSSPKRPTSACSAASCDEESEKNSDDFIRHEPPNVYDDATHQKSSSHITHASSQQSSNNFNNTSCQPTDPRLVVSDAIYSENKLVEVQGNDPLINTQEGKKENLTSNRELEEQVKKQEEMIRVLQEQVRSLLRMKEAISSESPSLPLTPVSTPTSSPRNDRELSHQSPPTRSEGQNTTDSQTVDGKQAAGSVTIGVNTGASLLWESARDHDGSCEKCRERKRLQSDQAQQDVLDNAEPPEHPDLFLTPEKTESLIHPSQVDVQVDSTPSSTPTISNMIIPSMSGEGDNIVSKQEVSTSREESVNENEIPVKGREFYDKLLCQVKDLLSEQGSTKKDDATKEHQPASQSFHVPTREVVVKATLRQLEKIKHSEIDATQRSSTRVQAESSSVFSTYQRSLSTSFIPEHPRLNYLSMSVDDTFDEVTYVDEVAMKYLSEEEFKQFKSEIRPSSSGAAAVKRSVTRTVRFGSLPTDNEHRSLSRRRVHEVDFTWNNLSFCTKDYLTKYNLVEGHVSITGEVDGQGSSRFKSKEEHSRETSLDIEPCKPPFPSPMRRHSEGSSDILDIKRLKNLPKLF